MSTRILVAVDLSENSAKTLAYAYHVALGLEAMVDTLHVIEAPISARAMGHPSAKELAQNLERKELEMATRELDRLMSGVPDDLRGKGIVGSGNPVDVICATAEPGEYEMVVVSTQGRTGFSHILIGSVAERVVRHAKVPVLVVR